MTSKSADKFNENKDEISVKELILNIRDWVQYILSKWVVILLLGILGAVLGFYYATMKKPIYTATTTFVLEDEKAGGGLGNLAGLASMAGVEIGAGGSGIFQGDNILELYKSRSMIKKTLLTEIKVDGRSKLLIDYYIEFNKLKEIWSEKPALANIVFTANSKLQTKESRVLDSIMTSIVNDINKNYLKVTRPDRKMSYISAQVKAPDELFAKVFNEQIVKNVNDFYIQTKTKKSAENISILQRKVDSISRVMNKNIYSAVAITDATPNLNPTRQTQRVVPVQRSQISVETNKAILATLLQNLELAKYAQAKDAPLIEVVDGPVLPLDKIKLSRLISLIIGGFVSGFLCVFYFTMKRIFINLGF